MNALAAAGHTCGVAKRIVLLAKPERVGRPLLSLGYRCVRLPGVALCTNGAQSRAQPLPPGRHSQAADSIKAAQASFFAPEGVSFFSLKLQTSVAQALQQAGFAQPSTVQVLMIKCLYWFRTYLCE